MKLYMSYILLFVATLMLNPFNQDKQVRTSLSNLNKAIYSGFLQSQNRVLTLDNLILSCKFKSMNRKSVKFPKVKDKINKSKI